MNTVAELDVWNFQVLMLVQAMQGAITRNFRMIALFREGDVWVIKYCLEEEIDSDIEEIQDIECQYTAYQDSSLKCRSEVVIGNGRLIDLDGGRVVYRRKE
ncbi:hypothetical protein YA0002_25760 [Pseudomonas cichorii]|uniref:hypothetical protein n=1 Tax=Pseudomonas cichorii TaxID=36746 RepID=UPI0018E5CFA6|nr:hypothetical protein [Pseudomonas cichorii]MBI6856170.1 hypothetical protein [Pseudomonas cichorii]